MLTEPASVSLAPLPLRMDDCELCTVGPEPLRTAVLICHARGGAIQLASCDRCATAMRRLIALFGSAAAGGPAQVLAEPEAEPPGARETVLSDTVGPAVQVYEFTEPFMDDSGEVYVVCVYGQVRSDGTWIGWLSFVAPDAQTVRRTPRETTQSNREHLEYWAGGLQPSYIEGAFHRAS